ncbi:uncharacterized protein [Asterias amurensis]|uniref:uncharacterized protein isoform X2 n=1 Tax=Asterias amurensis TaxID=7602 RepID=UPI003AB66339
MPKRKIHKDFKLHTVKKLIQGKGKSYRTVEVPLADAFHPRQNRKASTKSPQENGNLLESLDGDFRRVRKVNSGTSQSDPKYNNHMLIPKEEFDDFVHDYDDCVSSDVPDSSDLETGDAQRAQNKACQLETTGVFGAECRAGFPNMKHGERRQGASRRTPNTTKRKTSAYHCFMQQYLSSEEAVTGKKQLSYKAVQEGRVICDGLPPQIPLKKPTAYSKKALQNILMNKDRISFRVSPQPSSDNASTSTCQAAGGVNTVIHPEPATSGILLSEVNTIEQEVEIPEDLATLQNMMEPNKDTDSDLYIVERITDKKNEGGKLYYLVKWQDYKIQTWEPASNIPPAMRAAYQNK